MNELYRIFTYTGLQPARGSIRFADMHSAYDVRVHFDENTSNLTEHFFRGLFDTIYKQSRTDPRVSLRLGRIDFTQDY